MSENFGGCTNSITIKNNLDKISPTFCPSKWLQFNLYLHTGVTSSCCYASVHKVDSSDIVNNPLVIHNTPKKILERNAMIDGEQSPECSMCWNVENYSDTPSERITQSNAYKNYNFDELISQSNVVPQIISIAFDTLCNFKCVYCDQSQSSSWESDIKRHGGYNLKTDSKYNNNFDFDTLDSKQYDLIYNALKEVIVNYKDTITELNFLGGEPTMSPKMWDFLDSIKEIKFDNTSLSMVTNLGQEKLVRKMINCTSNFKSLQFKISIDGTGVKSEFIRYGVKWDIFKRNIEMVLNDSDSDVLLLGTINILSLDGLIESLEWYSQLPNKKRRMTYNINVCQFPSFQSVTTLPEYLREYYIVAINDWIKTHGKLFDDNLIIGLDILLALLNKDTCDSHLVDKQEDFKAFVNEFSRRNSLSIVDTFSDVLSSWILA
jgi:organic radical activating enzyme